MDILTLENELEVSGFFQLQVEKKRHKNNENTSSSKNLHYNPNDDGCCCGLRTIRSNYKL